jgi:hypothetical protein
MPAIYTEFEIALDVVKEGLLPFFQKFRNGCPPSNDQAFGVTIGFVMGARYKKISFPRVIEALDTVRASLEASNQKETTQYRLCQEILDAINANSDRYQDLVRNPNTDKLLHY